jgi:hypothetical protein
MFAPGAFTKVTPRYADCITGFYDGQHQKSWLRESLLFAIPSASGPAGRSNPVLCGFSLKW